MGSVYDSGSEGCEFEFYYAKERNSSDKYLYLPPFQPQFLPSFRR